MYVLFVLIVLICPLSTSATISPSFYSFIQTNFGQQVADQIARNDFGQRGNIPVIFVHGFLTTAGTTQPMATYFKQNYAYGDDELYATTFGRPAGSIPVQTALICEYVKAVRNLIQTVSQYTSSQVNAIKGGRCVDTGEELGPVLTSLVNAYLGVAGAMKGAQSCTIPFGVCNTLNGMSCGSQFLNDINSQHIPTIFVHGYGQKASNYEEVARAFKQYGNMHDSELYATTYGELQNPWISMNPFLNASPFTFQMHTVRNLIKAVAEFTKSKVNVVGYSLGGPLSRKVSGLIDSRNRISKAILGGKCVDADEDLGPPLTSTVNAYLGVSGAQRGCKACGMMIFASCNMLDGVHCGSKFLNDINSKSKYEGSKIYVLQSSSDEIVGLYACGFKASEINDAWPYALANVFSKNGKVSKNKCRNNTKVSEHNSIFSPKEPNERNVKARLINSRKLEILSTAQLIARRDINGGSFGGGHHEAGEKTKKKPVIFVHGYMTKAATTLFMAQIFKRRYGYNNAELYATTYVTSTRGNFRVNIYSQLEICSSGYEGHRRYVIQSSSDRVVGVTNLCGQRSSEFADATKIVTLSGLSHIQTCTNTAAIQHIYGDDFHKLLQSSIVYDNTTGQYVERKGEKRPDEVEMGICGGFAITGHDLITLYPRRKLNDTIISAYLQLIATRSEEKGREKKKNIFEYNVLLFPIHNGEHWSIVVADLNRRLFFYYDSLTFSMDEQAKLFTHEYVGHVKCFIESEAKTKLNVDFYCNDFDVVFINEPAQHNHFDCGVFVCCYAEFYCRHDHTLSFSQPEMHFYRIQMLGEILCGRLFEVVREKTFEMETETATTLN
ncbi:hypothetical protein M3Y96_01020600 [Aphelenchoides besseyi]|nr:hypothetical protein M3Y96_01020600 [Aphelenchoides besseyi]